MYTNDSIHGVCFPTLILYYHNLSPKCYSGKNPDAPHIVQTNRSGQVSVKTTDVAVTIDENFPLIKKETQISLDLVGPLLQYCSGPVVHN